MAIHVDTMAWSVGLGILFCWLFRVGAKAAHSGVPTGVLNFVELMVEFVDKSVKETFHGTSNLIAPLALTICCWIFLMNLMDLVPVDLFPYLFMAAGVEYMKIVPTTDVNATLGMSIGVFLLIVFLFSQDQGSWWVCGGAYSSTLRKVDDSFQFSFGRCWSDSETNFIGSSTIWQSICWRVDFYLNCVVAILFAMVLICALGYFSHSCDRASSIHFYDADDCLPLDGT